MITVKNNEFLLNTSVYSFPCEDFVLNNYRGSNPPGIYRSRSFCNPSKYAYLFVRKDSNEFTAVTCLNGNGELITLDQFHTTFPRESWEHCPQLRAEITIIED